MRAKVSTNYYRVTEPGKDPVFILEGHMISETICITRYRVNQVIKCLIVLRFSSSFSELVQKCLPFVVFPLSSGLAVERLGLRYWLYHDSNSPHGYFNETHSTCKVRSFRRLHNFVIDLVLSGR